MNRVIPLYAIGDPAVIVIDGIEYRPAVTDEYGHLGIHVLSATLPALAATSTHQVTMITALELIDDLQGALDAVKGDRLNVNAYGTGASEVTAAYDDIVSSTARTTLVTPTSGKKIRVISVRITFDGAGGQRAAAWFGTGAYLPTNPEKAVDEVHNGGLAGTRSGMVWPDGGGPVGAVDEVLSIGLGVSLADRVRFLVIYREE